MHCSRCSMKRFKDILGLGATHMFLGGFTRFRMESSIVICKFTMYRIYLDPPSTFYSTLNTLNLGPFTPI